VKSTKPEFHLTRVLEDGTLEDPQVVRVAGMPWQTKMDRRGAIGTGVALAGLIALLDICRSEPALAAAQSPLTQDSTSPICTAPGGNLAINSNEITAIAIGPDGKLLASTGWDRLIKLWSLPDGKLISEFMGATGMISSLAITPNGKVIVSSGEGYLSGDIERTVYLWSLPNGKLLSAFNGKTGNGVWKVAITPDGKILATGNGHGTVKLWSLSREKLIATLQGHRDIVTGLAFTPDGKVLATASYDSSPKLWSVPDGKLLATLTGGWKSAHVLAITPDGKVLLSGGAGDSVNMWSVPDGKLLSTLNGKTSSVSALAITPDGKILACGHDDVELWSLPDGKLLATLKGHTELVKELAITPDGKLLISGTKYRVILWDLPLALAGGNCVRGYLFDPKVTANDVKVRIYSVYDSVTQQTITYTLPCGSPVPPGATCTCNCVPGTYVPENPKDYDRGCITVGGGTICTCDKVCTCVPVPSSRRWKDNVQTLQGALHQTMQLRGVRFDWTADAPHHPAQRSDLGLIAEEVAQIVPEVVSFDENGAPRGVDYARLTALLVEAVKTQQTQLQQLRGEVEKLQARSTAS